MGKPSSIQHRSGKRASPVRAGRRRWGRLAVLVTVVVGAVLGGVFVRDEMRIRRLEADVETALADGQPRVAFQRTTQYLKEFPNDHQALALQARALVAGQRPDEALRIFSRIGAATAEDTHAWARACLLREDWQHALPLLVRAASLMPDSPELLHELAVCQMRLGRLREALQTAASLEQLPGGRASGLLLRASIHSDLNNHEAAAEAFAELLSINPQLDGLAVPAAEILTQYGGVLVAVGRAAEAIPVLDRVPDSAASAVTWHARGQAFLQLGEDERAVTCWQKAIELEPLFQQPREALADAALRRNDAELAKSLLAPILTVEPLAASTAYLAQRVFLRLGDRDQAEHWRETAARLRRAEQVQASVDNLLIESPESFWAQAVRARAFALEGNWSQAEAVIDQLSPGRSDSSQREHPFITALRQAIRDRTDPPPLEELPLTLH